MRLLSVTNCARPGPMVTDCACGGSWTPSADPEYGVHRDERGDPATPLPGCTLPDGSYVEGTMPDGGYICANGNVLD